MNRTFKPIANPYAASASGKPVGDPAMFFGRTELIQRIAHTIQKSRSGSKCILIYGQYRSGKSSVLYHLQKVLEKDKDLLVLNLGSIAAIADPDSKISFSLQILGTILRELRYAIESRVDKDFTPLNFSIPSDFHSHPNPLQYFMNTFSNFKRKASKQEDWRDIRVVLLIDDFQYIYDLIVTGKISGSFMQSWKTLLQVNHFSTVLVGQDVMPKFKEAFPNEFGATQDFRVTYLAESDAIQLIEHPIRIAGEKGESRYRGQAIKRILELTAGSPYYIQIVCDQLVRYMNDKRVNFVTEADVEYLKNELIHGVNALYLDVFYNLIYSGDISADAISNEDALKVLKVIADNSGETNLCPRDRIVCETDSPIEAILNDLVERDVLARERKRCYQIRVGLFKEWLIANG